MGGRRLRTLSAPALPAASSSRPPPAAASTLHAPSGASAFPVGLAPDLPAASGTGAARQNPHGTSAVEDSGCTVDANELLRGGCETCEDSEASAPWGRGRGRPPSSGRRASAPASRRRPRESVPDPPPPHPPPALALIRPVIPAPDPPAASATTGHQDDDFSAALEDSGCTVDAMGCDTCDGSEASVPRCRRWGCPPGRGRRAASLPSGRRRRESATDLRDQLRVKRANRRQSECVL